MKSSDTEEGGAKKRRAPGILKQPHAFIDQPEPFTDVQSGENNAEQNRGPQKSSRLGFVSGFRGVYRTEHRQAAGDEDGRHNQDVEYAGAEFERRRPIDARSAQITVPVKEDSKGRRIGDNEQPHRQFS